MFTSFFEIGGPCQISTLAVLGIWRHNLQGLLNTKYSTSWINLREILLKIRFWKNIHYKEARTALQVLVDHAITSRQWNGGWNGDISIVLQNQLQTK